MVFLRIIYLVIFMQFLPSSSTAEDLAAVKSIENSPYNEALTGFRQTILDRKISEFTLSEDRNNNKDIVLTIRNSKSELIFTLGSEALKVIKENFNDTPVIFAFVLNPDTIIGNNRPRNITGVEINIPPIDQFRTLLKLIPNLKRIGAVYDPAKSAKLMEEAGHAASSLGITLVKKRISAPSDAIKAISEMEGKVDAIWMIPDTTAITQESVEFMLLFSIRNNVPLIGLSEKYVKNGALFSVSFDSEDIGRQAGEAAIAILEGKHGTELPYLKPRNLKISLNMNTAKKLGVSVPDEIIRTAHKVYQ